jgi:hypothetical protein
MMWILHYCLPAIHLIIHSYVLGAHDVSGESWQLVTAIFMMKVMV